LQVDQLPSNILKILASEGSSSLSQKFIQQLNIGQFLKGRVVQIFSDGKSQIDFGGQKLIVEGNFSFKAGQTLTAQVKQLTPVPEFKLANNSGSVVIEDPATTANDFSGRGIKQVVTLSSRPSAPISIFAKTNLEFLKLSQGKVYQTPVKQVLDAETAIIQLNNRNFIVKTNRSQPLKPGDQIPVIAQRAENGSFHLTQTNGPVISRVDPGMIKPYLSVRQPFGEMVNKLTTVVREVLPGTDLFQVAGKETLARLEQTIQALTSGTEKTPSAQMVKEQVNLSGMDYEVKVKQFLEKGANPETAKGLQLNKDLKGQLLEIIQKLESQVLQKGASSTQLQTLKDTVQVFRQAVDNIELHQLTNQLAKQEGQPLLLQIPNPYANGDPTIKLYVRPSQDEEEGNKGKTKQNFHLVFLLNLSNLGNIRVDSQIVKSQLSLKMTVENQFIADFISSHAQDFESRLDELGFQADLTCCVQDKIDMEPHSDLPEILMKHASQLVDVTT
jgi:hypothetical protein